MTNCGVIAKYLGEIRDQNVTTQVPEGDLTLLQQQNLILIFSSDQVQQLSQEVQRLEQARATIAQESGQRSQAANQVGVDTRRTHSILFHLEGADHQHSQLERLQQEQQALRSLDTDLAQRQQDFAQLLIKRAQLASLTPYGERQVALTTSGRVALRDLTVRLYRVSDQEFSAYWAQSQKIDTELLGIANQGALYERALAGSLKEVDPSYLWAVSIGMAKAPGSPQVRLEAFLSAYNALAPYSSNVENLLMATEILAMLPRPPAESVLLVTQLRDAVKQSKVPDEAALGVATILLLGQRADGTLPLPALRDYLPITPSYEAAAMMAIVNRPEAEVVQRFRTVKSLFQSWGHSQSEDTELSSAYLAISELPLETVGPKMAIISHGLSGYLQYPLVGSAILASIPVLEANETLNLLEKAYEILGQRTGPLSQAEGICLAIRMVHGIDVRTVDELDSTQAVAQTPGFTYGTTAARLWVPVYIAHGFYYSTWSGIGGPHPGHVHTWGGGGWGGGFVG